MKERIIKSILDLLILQFLKDNPFSGNQIAREINRQYNVRISSATINAAFIRLENNNLIIQKNGKIYTLMRQGKRMRVQMKKNYLRLQKSIKQQLKER